VNADGHIELANFFIESVVFRRIESNAREIIWSFIKATAEVVPNVPAAVPNDLQPGAALLAAENVSQNLL
jgi:hypothetical protein